MGCGSDRNFDAQTFAAKCEPADGGLRAALRVVIRAGHSGEDSGSRAQPVCAKQDTRKIAFQAAADGQNESMTETGKIAARPIRSFIRRQGRMTRAQHAALDTLWPDYGLDPAVRLAPETVFSRRAPLVLEIGFGDGESLAEMAAAHPEKNYVGIEVHMPGVGHLMLRLKALALQNVRIYCFDAVEILTHSIPDGSLSGINLFFPDPWPKKKHHKRRILTPEFVGLALTKLQQDGIFHAASDWEDYAMQMLAVLEQNALLENTAGAGSFAPRPGDRPITKFERRGLRLGHGVWDLIYRRP